MNHSRQSRVALSAFIFTLCLLLAGCALQPTATVRPTLTSSPTASPSPLPTPTPTPQVIRVEAVVQDREGADLRIRNCESIEDLRDTLASRVVVEIGATVAETATTANGGQTGALPPDLRKQLEGLVRQAYQDVYAAALADLMKVELIVPGETTIVC